jgi:pimeloyl-ACP methyl ester carboxylesterase
MKLFKPNCNLTLKLGCGRLLGFAEYGNPTGNTIFYFHGFPGSRLEAGHFHDLAASNQYRLIAIDRPGMGLSTLDTNRSVLSWASDVASFADSIGVDKFSIFGHSGGAAFVAACAYAIPERLNGAAIVSGIAPFEIPEAKASMPRGQRVVNSAIKTMPWLATVMMKLTFKMLKNPNGMIKQMIKQLPEIDQIVFHDPDSSQAIIAATTEAFRNGVAGPALEMNLLLNPWGFDLGGINYPVSVWQGGLDTQVPAAHGDIYAKSIPRAQLKFFKDEGHHSLIRNHATEILRSISK